MSLVLFIHTGNFCLEKQFRFYFVFGKNEKSLFFFFSINAYAKIKVIDNLLGFCCSWRRMTKNSIAADQENY